MKLIIAAAAGLTIAFGAGSASAAGCLKGGAVGAGVGHVAGGHAVLGGIAGCVVGRHRANAAERRGRDQQASPGTYDNGRNNNGGYGYPPRN